MNSRPLLFALCLIMLFSALACSPVSEQVSETAATEVVISVVPTNSPIATLLPAPTPTATPEPTPSPTPYLPLAGVIIGIDPGHQLIYNPSGEHVAPDSYELKQKTAGGARGIETGTYEYEINLNVGLKLRDILEQEGATVWMTHEVLDVDISNIERAQFFNDHNVDLGIRLHCNQSSEKKDCGAYMLVPSKNRTDWFEQNELAAKYIINSYCALTGLKMQYAKKEGIVHRSDQTGFNWCTRPICNIEMGHLSYAADDVLISDPDFQSLMAQGIANGITAYFTDYPPQRENVTSEVNPVSDTPSPSGEPQ